MMFSSATTLAKLLQVRPLVIELLESMDSNFWNHLELSVEDYCRERGLDAVSLIKKAGSLPVPPKNLNWNDEPLYRLVDFLTADHRRFQETDLPEISHLLDLHNIPVYPDGYVLKLAFQSYKAFEEKFLNHMREEEEHVFPHILQLEACHRLTKLDPHLHRGAVGVFAETQNHSAEEELKRRVEEIREKVSEHRLQEPTASVTHTIHRKLEELESRLAAHAVLEVEYLFPRATAIEKRLMTRERERQRDFLPYTAPV